MFGVPSRVRRPTLLILVLGAFLVLIGITASAQSSMVSAHFSASALNDLVGSDSATVRGFVNAYVQPRYLGVGTGGMTAAELERLEAQLATLTARGEILRVELRLPDGTILAANDKSLAGLPMPVAGAFALAVAGTPRPSSFPRLGRGRAGPAVRGADAAPRVPAGDRRQAGPCRRRHLARRRPRSSPASTAVRRDVVIVTLTAGAHRRDRCCSSSSGPRRAGSPARRPPCSRRPAATR